MLKVWIIRKDILPDKKLIRYLENFLDKADMVSICKYKKSDDRTNSLLSRTASKYFLSKFSKKKSSEITIGLNRYMKPYVIGEKIHFNVSHSGIYFSIAVSHRYQVGVDIELVRPISINDIMHFFSKPELTYINSAKAANDRLIRFYKIWTLKEAYLKYKGYGFLKGGNTPSFNIIGKKTALTHEKTLIFKTILCKDYVLSVCSKESIKSIKILTLSEFIEQLMP